MNTGRSSVGRADLLRLLAALDQAGVTEADKVAGVANCPAAGQLAQMIDFYQRPSSPVPAFTQWAHAAFAATSTASAEASVTRAPPAARVPLRAPLFGITRVTPIEPDAAPAPTPPLLPLLAADYLPRAADLPAQPLLRNPALVRRIHSALARPAEGRALDVARAVQQLARAQTPDRWQRHAWVAAPAHVTVIVDRSLHLRPYWDDQDQLVHLLAQWLGAAQLCTVTVQGDPWHPLAAWAHGREHTPAPPLAAQPADGVVLLLTDMACLRADPAPAAGLARWTQAASCLGGAGARVLLCPPCSATQLPTGGSLDVAWYPLPQHVSRHRHPARALIRPVPMPTAYGAPPQIVPALELLLILLSCARRIESPLVRALRLLHPALACEPGLEAQLWAAHSVLAVGYDVCVWHAATVVRYRKQFATLDPALQQAVWHVMREVHGVRGRTIEVLELLTWASHVATATAAPFESEIAQAKDWLARLPLGVDGRDEAEAEQAGLIAFAQQTQAFQGADDQLMTRFADVFGPLWGIAHLAAERRGQVPPAAGALPVERLDGWRLAPRAGLAPRRQQLQQVHGQLVLQPPGDGLPSGWSPMGMSFELDALALTSCFDADDARAAPGGGTRFSHPGAEGVVLGDGWPGRSFDLHTATLALNVAEIAAPLGAVERGRDCYGLYVDLLMPSGAAEAAQRVRMRYIEPGQFLMGSPDDEVDRQDIEGPQHRVTISRGFWLADTACTQALWQAVMGKNPSRFYAGYRGGREHPVESVSWDMVQDFLQKLTVLMALPQHCQFSLPTEAEWEYACRAGSVTPFSFGGNINVKQVSFSGNFPYRHATKGEYREQTIAVKALPCNAWGLYQMHGNVWEWCADTERRYLAQSVVDPGLDVAAQAARAARALRGGCWIDGAQSARSAFRFRDRPGWRDFSTGFRFALRFSSEASK
jgi:formylglycine-generating enzyme required for sulfatase activity